MEEIEDIFKVGDRVFHIQNGWGTVGYSPKDDYYLVNFDKNSTTFWYTKFNNKILSFTEYTLEGFSQERPEELPKKGQIVWGRDYEFQSWHIYHFSHKAEDGIYHLSSDNKRNMFRLKQITTENPYENN
jgi:hypothetical protein